MSGTPVDIAPPRMRQRGVVRVLATVMGAGILSGAGLAFAAGNADADKIDFEAMAWAGACISCHGGADEVEGSRISSLAGMPADEFVSKMKNIAASDTAGALMPQLARGYDEATLERMGQYFEKLGETR